MVQAKQERNGNFSATFASSRFRFLSNVPPHKSGIVPKVFFKCGSKLVNLKLHALHQESRFCERSRCDRPTPPSFHLCTRMRFHCANGFVDLQKFRKWFYGVTSGGSTDYDVGETRTCALERTTSFGCNFSPFHNRTWATPFRDVKLTGHKTRTMHVASRTTALSISEQRDFDGWCQTTGNPRCGDRLTSFFEWKCEEGVLCLGRQTSLRARTQGRPWQKSHSHLHLQTSYAVGHVVGSV